MRLVPLIATIGLLGHSASSEVIDASSGRSPAAMKVQNEGQELLNRGDLRNARSKFDEAIRIDPSMWAAFYNRALLNSREHKFQQAIADANAALRIKSSFTRLAILRADANAKLGNYEAAFRELDHLISLGQRGDAYPQVLNMSAWWRAVARESRYRNARLAITQAEQSCRLTSYKNPGIIDSLAAAYAEAGDFDAAIRTQEKAISLTTSPQDMKDAQKHMTAFKKHRPWRENAASQ